MHLVGAQKHLSLLQYLQPLLTWRKHFSTLDYTHRARNIQNKPEVNQKLNKKELIGEYTVEIERLRCDLMAMHEKHGVYLASEKYQDMINTMESQAQEITEKIGHTRALKEDIEKTTEMFLDTNCQLEDTSEKLRKTKSRLDSTQNTLNCTQKLLHNTARERDAQKYLVSAYVKTEEKLKTQSRALVEVTEDISKLFDKLDRKKKAENKNIEASEEFQQSYRKCIDAIRVDMMSTVTEQSDAVRIISSQFDDCMKKYKRKAMQIYDQLTNLGQNQSTLINTFLTIYKIKVEAQVTSANAMNDHVCHDSNQQQMLVNTFQNNEALPILDKLASLISSNASNIMKLPLVLNSKLSAIDEGCEKFHQQQYKQIVQLKEELNTFMEVHFDRTETRLASVNNLIMSSETHNQSMSSTITVLIDSLLKLKHQVQVFNSTSSEGLTNLLSNLNLDQENRKTADSNMQLLVKNIIEESSGHVLTTNDLKSEAQVTMDELFNQLESDVQYMGEERCGLESTIDSYTNKACKLISNMLATVQDHSKDMETKAAEDIKSTTLDMKKEVTNLTQELEMNNKSLEAETSKMELASSHLKNECQLVFNNLLKWSHKLNEELNAQEAEVMELLNKKMVNDLPTGETPVRREYPFSKVLSSTSPHDRILERYNSKTASTLSRIPLPSFGDETEDEMGSLSVESSQLSSSGCSQHEEELAETGSQTGSISLSKGETRTFIVPDPPLQREDSGIPLSRSSSSSSLNDFKENKENSKLVHSGSTKKRELKQPSLHPSSSMEKLAVTETAVRPRRILGLQN